MHHAGERGCLPQAQEGTSLTAAPATSHGALPADYSGLGVAVPPDFLAFLAARFSLREREAAFLPLRPALSLFPISASDQAALANGTTSFCHKSGHRSPLENNLGSQ